MTSQPGLSRASTPDAGGALAAFGAQIETSDSAREQKVEELHLALF